MPTFRSSSRSRAAQFARWNEVRRRTGYRSQFEADIAAALEGTGAAYESSRLACIYRTVKKVKIIASNPLKKQWKQTKKKFKNQVKKILEIP